MKVKIHLMILAAVLAVAAMADSFQWVGNGDDNYWGTDANWSKTSGDSDRTKPYTEDFAVFSQAEDLTVLLYESTNVQGVRLEQGTGSVTLTLEDGWYNGRQLLVRRTKASNTWRPGVTNFVNNSSYPLTIKSGSNASLNILFDYAWGDFAMMPGVVFDCSVAAATDARGRFLPQETLRTDNAEMNKTVFKRTATFYNTLYIGENHELWVSGENAALSVDYGQYKDNDLNQYITIEESLINLSGILVVDGATASVSCSNLNVAATGAIGGSGTINGAVSATSGAKLLFGTDNVLTFTDAADLTGFTVDATGCTAGNEYLVAKGTTSLPGVLAAQAAEGWMTKAKDGNVYLVNSLNSVATDVEIGADTDWSVSPVEISDNVKIDLNGHDLSIGYITLGSGVTFVNSGDKARLYAGLNGADKSWLLEQEFPATIMPVFVGAAIEIPSTYIPAGGIGFKDTTGEAQSVNYESCANGFAFLGNANITEPLKSWQNGVFPIAVYGDGNVFTLYADNSSSKDGSFSGKPFSGDGTLTIASTTDIRTAYLIGSDTVDNTGFTGGVVLTWGSNFGGAIEFGDPKAQSGKHFSKADVVLCGKENGEASQFLLASNNGSSTANFCFDSLATDGDNAVNVILATSSASSGGTYLRIGTNGGGSGVFAGTFTNYNGDAARPYNIEKHGTGTWTLTGTVANGGAFTVAEGCVEFRNGLENVSSLTVASGASVLFAGDMGASSALSLASGSTLKLDASSEGDDVPVVTGDFDLTGLNLYVTKGETYTPSKTTRELLRVTGTLTGFDKNSVGTDIDAADWSFRLVKNIDGSTSIVHQCRKGFAVIFR